MSLLLAKILFLLLLAALLGAWFGYWWVRRQYDDVTGEYSRLKSDWQSWRKGFEEKLAARPEVDLKPLAARIDDVPGVVRGILFPFQDRLAALEAAVAAIKIPAPKDVDLGPVSTRIEALEGAVRGIRIPPPPVIPPAQVVDLEPLLGRLAAVESAVRAAHVDLGPVMQRLDALAAAPPASPAPPQSPAAPPAPPIPAASAPAASASPAPVAVAPAMAAVVRSGSRNLLAHAAFGAPDDLQLIKGVARVMERMLHDIGVYYFWQIAEWTPADVAHADAQLTAFRGRIERDHWVQQARQFATRPKSARKPGAA